MAYSEIRVLPEAQFGTFDGVALTGAGETLWASLLLRVSNTGRVEDHFLVRLSGSQRLTASFEASAVTEAGELQQFRFAVERRPAELVFKNNSFVTKWEDLVDLVASNKVMASRGDVANADQAFREEWERAKGQNANLGISLRWSVQARPPYGFKLALQALPGTTRSLRRDARLSNDRASCIELFSWTVATTMGEAGQWNGPVPVLFAADPVLAATNLRANPGRFSPGNNAK
jgi:hypothetical protein